MEPRRAVITLAVAGAVGTIVLASAVTGVLAGELMQSHSNLRASIVGVYRIDSRTGQTFGPAGAEFSQSDDVVAEVDWSQLPGSTEVSAEWYDSSGDLIDSSGPGPAKSVPTKTVMLASDNSGAGWYAFEVERWSGDERVETLARVVVDLQ